MRSYIDSRLAEGASVPEVVIGMTYWASINTRPKRVKVISLRKISDDLTEATVIGEKGTEFTIRTCYLACLSTKEK